MDRLFSGRNDLPLNAYGKAQALALRNRLRSMEGVAAVVTSPLRRAQQTAAVIADPAPARIVEGLAEIDFGSWEGLAYDDIVERWPTEFAAFCNDDTAAPGGESFSQLTRRTLRALGDIQSSYPGGTVVVVSHVTPIKALLCSALNAPREAMFRMHLDTASISVIDYFDEGVSSLRLLNDTAHLAGVTA
jgi:probable phosphoglycerate mutase